MIVFLTIIFCMHFFFFFSGDDISYFSSILDNYSLKDFLITRYNTWSSRVIIESILVVVSRNIYLWRILDVCMIVLLVYSVNKIFFKESNSKNIILCCFLFFLYPMNDMRQAGFAATTTNYLWCLSCMMFSFIPYRNIYFGENIKKRWIPFYIFSLIYACNQEQAVCIIIMVSAACLIECIRKKRNYKYILLCLGIAISSLIFILTCPGNTVRKMIEINNYYPEYINLNVLDKIYLGLTSTLSLLAKNIFVLWFFTFCIMVCTFLKKENIYNKTLSVGMILIVSLLSIFRLYTILTKTESIIFDLSISSSSVCNLKLLMMGILIVCIYAYLLYLLFRENNIPVIGLFLVGGASRVMMGFSPTVFASGCRTMIFLYWTLLLIMIMLYKRYENELSRKLKFLLFVILVLLIMLNYMVLFLSI